MQLKNRVVSSSLLIYMYSFIYWGSRDAILKPIMNCEPAETGIAILPAVHKILPQPFQLSTHLPVPSHYCWTESLPWIVCLHTKIKIRKGMKVKVSGIEGIQNDSLSVSNTSVDSTSVGSVNSSVGSGSGGRINKPFMWEKPNKQNPKKQQ